MSNPELARLVASGLFQGLKHPGHPESNIAPSVLKLPGFNTTGMSKAQSEDFLGNLGMLFGEAIIELIEKDGASEIIAKVDTDAWRKHTAQLERDRDDAIRERNEAIAALEAITGVI